MDEVTTEILKLALLLAFSFLYVSGLFWLVCFAFDITFSWKYTIGVWAILSLVKSTNYNK